MEKFGFLKISFISLFFTFIIGCNNKGLKTEQISKQVVKDTSVTSIETITKPMMYGDLKEKSSAFLRYSRNQIFAKQGYVFNDSNLNIFFINQDWYSGEQNQQIKLDSTDLVKVDLLKSLENNIDSVEYSRIIHKFLYNGFPLYYIGWQPQIINNDLNEFFNAGFALLDSSLLWTMSCSTIPPEYVLFKSVKFIDMIDDQYYLRKDKIWFENIDKGCKGGEFDEIIINLKGPSDDYNDVILGFNEEGEFDVLFDEFVTINNISKINDTTLEFTTLTRCDFIGTMFCDKRYHYNTVTKSVTDLSYDFDKVELETENREIATLYLSSKAAIEGVNDSINGYLPIKTEVTIIKFLSLNDCYWVKSDSLNGWIDDDQLQKFEVSFAD